jgi:hypothetical protein
MGMDEMAASSLCIEACSTLESRESPASERLPAAGVFYGRGLPILLPARRITKPATT